MIEILKQSAELREIGFGGLLIVIIFVLIWVIKKQFALRENCQDEKETLHDEYQIKLDACNKKLLKLARGKEIEE